MKLNYIKSGNCLKRQKDLPQISVLVVFALRVLHQDVLFQPRLFVSCVRAVFTWVRFERCLVLGLVMLLHIGSLSEAGITKSATKLFATLVLVVIVSHQTVAHSTPAIDNWLLNDKVYGRLRCCKSTHVMFKSQWQKVYADLAS